MGLSLELSRAIHGGARRTFRTRRPGHAGVRYSCLIVSSKKNMNGSKINENLDTEEGMIMDPLDTNAICC